MGRTEAIAIATKRGLIPEVSSLPFLFLGAAMLTLLLSLSHYVSPLLFRFLSGS
jgi:hypothetical protein